MTPSWRRLGFDGLDFEDGADPRVTLSRDNPLNPVGPHRHDAGASRPLAPFHEAPNA